MNNKVLEFLISCLAFLWDNVVRLFLWAFGFYLLPTFELIGVTIFILMMEMLTSIHKYKFLGEWKNKEVRRSRYFQTFNKLILYTIGIVSTYVLQHHIAKDLIQVMYFFVAIITVREFSIIISNIEAVTGTKIWYYLKKHVNQILKLNEDNERKTKQ